MIIYKATHNTRLILNPVTTEFFDHFLTRIPGFLFVIIHYDISKYQSEKKVLRLLDGKIEQSKYGYKLF